MTTARRLAVLLTAALPLALAGCGGDTCPTEVAKVSAAPASCQLAPNTVVTVTVPLCTSCNQSAPACVVVPPDPTVPGDRSFQLDTTAQACTSDSSCPGGAGCFFPAPSVTCTFQTPPVGSNNNWFFTIIDQSGVQVDQGFTVAANGGTGCTG